MGKLIAASGKQQVLRGTARSIAFGVGRRDEAEFAVEDAEQVIEVSGAIGVAGRF